MSPARSTATLVCPEADFTGSAPVTSPFFREKSPFPFLVPAVRLL